MGGIGEAIAAPLVGGAISSIFGKKDKSPSAAGVANSAPIQTEGQKWADGQFRNVIEGWMTNPPKINIPKPTQTKVTYGSNFGSGSQQPAQQGQAQTQFFGSGASTPQQNQAAFNGPRLPNVYPGMDNPTIGQPFVASQPQTSGQGSFGAGGFSFTPGEWQNNAANQGIQTQIDNLKSQYQSAINSAGALGTREGLQAQLDDLVQKQSQGAGLNSAQLEQLRQMGIYRPEIHGARMGWVNPQKPGLAGRNTTAATTTDQYASQIKDIESKLAQLNQYEGQVANYQSQIDDLEKQLGPDQVFQGGELNIPAAPEWQSILGSVGTYQPIFADPNAGFRAMDYSQLINAFMNPVEMQSASTNPYGTFQENDYSNRIGQIDAPISAPAASTNPYGAFQENDYQGQISQITDYENALRQGAADQAQSNLSRTFREGYDDSYLKDLAASQIDPLKEMFGEAIKQATADFNRRGLAGSGFESLDKYGAQDSSIMTRFMKEAGNVARDVALRGAEAAREDQYRNASMQDQAISLANQIGAGLSADQLQRTQAGLSATMNQDQMNESNRQFWDQNQLNKNQIDYGREMDSRQLTQAALNAQMQEDQMNESNRQFWNQDWLSKNQVDYGRAMDQKDLLKTGLNAAMQQDSANEANRQRWVDFDRQLAQQNEGNRMNWANLLNNQNIMDQQQQQNDWTRNLEMMKWLVGREDDLTNRQQSADLSQQTLDYDMIKDLLNYLASFSSGQAPVANNMQQNYWQAYNAQNQQNAANQAYNQNLANGVAGMFSNAMNQQSFYNNAIGSANNVANQVMGAFGVPIAINPF